VPIVLKSGILNLLEPSGPVYACNGIALPFLLCYQGYLKPFIFRPVISVLGNILKMFGNRMLRGILGPRKQEKNVTQLIEEYTVIENEIFCVLVQKVAVHL
jgi:hypothetical protein